MTISIRKFLLINLLLAITVTTTLTVLGNYYLDQRDIHRHMDTLLATSTLSYQALLGDDVDTLNLPKLQMSLNEINAVINSIADRGLLTSSEIDFAKQFNLQVWSDSNQLLLRSPNAPKIPLSSGKEGFSDEVIDGKKWRVFTAYNKQSGTNTMVGERYDTRAQLSRMIAQDDIYIMLLMFPLSGFLIWFIIGRGLKSLTRIAKDVANRRPNYLEPVDQSGVPLEIKPVINELNKLFLRLQSAFEREKRFAGDAAHELRTPIAGLKTHTQVALKTQDAKERKDALKKLVSGVNRASHTIQQLLTMSRLMPETTYIDESSQVNLEKLSTEIIAELAPDAIEKHIDIALDIKSDRVWIYGNETAMSILIRNIIDNAIRYTLKDGHIMVSLLSDKHHIILRVTDTGPGIPHDLRTRVFERFYRILGTQQTGSGLGLSIVAQIAKLHYAEVQLDTPESGQGLQIDILFPRRLKESMLGY